MISVFESLGTILFAAAGLVLIVGQRRRALRLALGGVAVIATALLAVKMDPAATTLALPVVVLVGLFLVVAPLFGIKFLQMALRAVFGVRVSDEVTADRIIVHLDHRRRRDRRR